MVMHCRDCRFWTAPDFDEWELPVQVAYGIEKYGACQLGVGRSGEPHIKASLAFALDAEDYAASLRTLPDFGCVQFQRSEVAP